jgi:hypothetical protein
MNMNTNNDWDFYELNVSDVNEGCQNISISVIDPFMWNFMNERLRRKARGNFYR